MNKNCAKCGKALSVFYTEHKGSKYHHECWNSIKPDKLDSGKNMVGMVLEGFPNAFEAVSKVGTFGAKKYSPHGHLTVKDGEARYKDAMMRHLLEHFKEPDSIDSETGLSHLSAVAWNALAMLELNIRNKL